MGENGEGQNQEVIYTSAQNDFKLRGVSQSQGFFRGRTGSSKSGPSEARQENVLAFGEHNGRVY